MKRKTSDNLEKTLTEKQLTSRLRTMGLILLAFSLGFFVYASTTGRSPYEDGVKTPDESTLSSGVSALSEETSLNPHDTLNFFAISLVFAGIGICCMLVAWKKKQSFESPSKKM